MKDESIEDLGKIKLLLQESRMISDFSGHIKSIMSLVNDIAKREKFNLDTVDCPKCKGEGMVVFDKNEEYDDWDEVGGIYYKYCDDTCVLGQIVSI